MKDLAQKILNEGKHVIADFICPTAKTREDFNADIVIWANTIRKWRFEDSNKMFVKPNKFDFRVAEKMLKPGLLKLQKKFYKN